MQKFYKILSALCLLIWSGSTYAQDYTSLVQDYLSTNRQSLNVSVQDVSSIEVYNQVYTKHNKVTHVYATQTHNGIEVYNAIANVAVKNGNVVYASTSLEKNIAARVNATTPSLNVLQAAVNVASKLDLGVGNFSIEKVLSSREYLLSEGGVSQEKIPVKLVYQPLENTIRLAWDLSILTNEGDHWWSVRVDALTGDILDQTDWMTSCTFESEEHVHAPNDTSHEAIFLDRKAEEISENILAGEQYNVYPVPVESPAHGERSIITEPQNPLASPYGWHDVDGVDGAEFTFTRGNNVWAREDQDGNNGGGAAPDGGDDLIFDFPIDLTQEPEDYLDASTTNLFYWNNIVHDVFFNYGFDEEAGNFQFTNYSGVGQGNDYVNADAQDGSGTNNATFGTPPDGGQPRMSMFLWSASSVPDMEVNAPGSLAGGYGISSAAFGDSFPIDGLTGDLALAQDDDSGVSTDPTDACDTLINPDDLTGKIAVVRRGECTFVIKVKAAQDAGALAVIVVNNVPTPVINLGGNDGSITIPSGMVSQAEGEALIAALENGDTVNVTISAPAPTGKDGSLDNGIIAHEYGHGISNRLTAGPANTGCLGNAEQMGEGWSDYVGLMLTMEPGDSGEDIRGIGTYATGAPISSQGIRPAAYSIDRGINDLTYGDVADASTISQPHGIGTVWSTMLWDMTWLLIDEYGFDADFYTGNGGNNLAMQLVTDGMKLQPCQPGFVSGRDAIIASIDLNDDIQDKDLVKCLVWTAFADRGVGFSASQGSSNSRFDQIEAFDMPPAEELDCEGILSVEDRALNAFSVYPNPSNGLVTINIKGSFGEGSVSLYDINGREVYRKETTLEGAVTVDAQRLSAGVYILKVDGGATHTTKLIIQ